MNDAETGWLIEHPDTAQSVQYVTLRPGSPEAWTQDHERALRFARRQDADDYWGTFGDDTIAARVVEHAWR